MSQRRRFAPSTGRGGPPPRAASPSPGGSTGGGPLPPGRSLRRRLALALPGLLLVAGCATPAAPPPEPVEARAMFQRIANELPRADLGLGTPPGVVEYSASAKAEGKAPEPEPLKATERGFAVRVHVYRPRTVTIPYAAIDAVTYGWRPIPNAVLAPLLIVPLQRVGVTVVVDGAKVSGLLDQIERECVRLEAVSREIGLGGPWSHAQDVRAKLQGDAAAHGPGRITIELDRFVPVPAWFPRGGAVSDVAAAFEWARLHPTVTLPPKPEEKAPPAEKKP